jgi:hypothetical protein
VPAKQVKLSPALEKSLLAGVLGGVVDVTLVNQAELSAEGRAVYRAARDMFSRGAVGPLAAEAVLLYVTDTLGANAQAAQAYLESVYLHLRAAPGAEDTLRRVREKHALLAVINTANEQLQQDEFNVDRFVDVLRAHTAAPELLPLAETFGTQLPPPPPRLAIPSLPVLTERIDGGLVGITAVSGEPGTGKTCLAWQIALDVGQDIDVAYYNLDDSTATLLNRTGVLFGGDPERVRAATRRIYVRDDIASLETDLMRLAPPALVVVDSVQTLPAPTEFRKSGLDAWIRRFKGLRKRGYYFLLLSEVPKSRYGAPASIGSFKETGDIEYAADLAWQLIPTAFGVELHAVKNRHGETKGLAATLIRAHKWLWQEASA